MLAAGRWPLKGDRLFTALRLLHTPLIRNVRVQTKSKTRFGLESLFGLELEKVAVE